MHRVRVTSSLSLFPLLASSLLGVGCGSDGGGSGFGVEEYIVRVTAEDGAEGRPEPGPIGEGPGDLMGPVVEGPSMGITGGSGTYVVSASAGTAALLVGVEGVDGIWRVDAAAATELLVSFGATPPATDFDLTFQALDGDGVVGAEATLPVSLITVGTGELQVSLSWDTETDVDLHVVEPDGEEIFYGNDVSQSGGELDLDSNAACGIDGVNNENITWARRPPRGEYIVRVDYWDNCGVGEDTDFVVTIRREGAMPETFQGSLSVDDVTMGGAGDGVTVTRFRL